MKFREQLLYLPLRLRAAKTKVVWRRRRRLHQEKDISPSRRTEIKHERYAHILAYLCGKYKTERCRHCPCGKRIHNLVSAACVGRAFLIVHTKAFYDCENMALSVKASSNKWLLSVRSFKRAAGQCFCFHFDSFV